jgi:hypothetical protein
MISTKTFIAILLFVFLINISIAIPQYNNNNLPGVDIFTFTSGNGTIGPQGPQGPPGQNGTNGINGTDGSNGADGTNGINGVNGTFSGILNLTQFQNDSNITYSINETWLTFFVQSFNYITSWLIPNTTNGYLYNDSTQIFFNDTHLNNTIDERITNQSITIFVPYENATGNVTLGNYSIRAYSVIIPVGGKLSFNDTGLNDSYFLYNTTSHRLELWVNQRIQQDWGNSTTIYGTATFEANAFFKNISGDDVVLDANLRVTGNSYANKTFAGNICYSDGTNCTINNSTNITFTVVGPYLYILNNSLNFNDSLLNQTISNLSKNQAFNVTTIVITSGGTGTGTSPILNGFLITRIIVTPNTLTDTYNFQANFTSTGISIDTNRMNHLGVWSIRKNQAVNNDNVTFTITNSVPDDSYSIRIEYINNFNP